MDYVKALEYAAMRHCELTGRSLGSLSLEVVNDNKFFDRIKAGKGCNIHTYQKFMDWLVVNRPRSQNVIKYKKSVIENNK